MYFYEVLFLVHIWTEPFLSEGFMPKKRKKGSFSMSSRYFFVICSECRMTKEANLPASEKS